MIKILLPVFVFLLVWFPGEAIHAEKLQNVLLITVDDMNCDASTFGYEAVPTPNLDRLAAMGVNFQRAYCQMPLCGPSRASFMTGLRPDTLNMHQNRTNFRKNIPDVQTLGQLFQKNGYVSARVGKIYHYNNPASIGTDGHDDPPSWTEKHNPEGIDNTQKDKITVYPASKKGSNLGISMSWWDPVSEDSDHTDGKVCDKTIELLKKHKNEPFFIACGFFNPHCPYVAPKKYFDLHPLETITMQPLDQAKVDLEDVPPMALGRDMKNWPYYFPDITYDEARKCKQAYYATISFLDVLIGKLIDTVESEGLMENTTIVFLSDHGYFLGEKGLWYKRKSFERSAKVPFIISTPETRTNKIKTKTCLQPVELLDLYPTLAEVTGVAGAPKNLEGTSLVPLLTNPQSDWNKPAVTQTYYGSKNWGYTIRVPRYRYIEWFDGNGGLELYDLENDPDEKNNLAQDPKYSDRIKALAAKLKPYKNLPASKF